MSEAKAFEGWGVVEVMGHRTIAGRISEVSVAGAAMLRVDVPGHGGRCISCRGSGKDPDYYRQTVPCQPCAGTGKASSEEPDFIATQFYGSAAIFSITPTTEEAARAVAMKSRPAPVVELPALPAAPVTPVTSEKSDRDDDEEIPY